MADIDQTVKIKKLLVGSQAPGISSGKDKGTKLSNPNASYFNKSIQQLRQAGSELEAINQLARVHGDVSATVSAMVRLANSGLKFRVFDDQHQLSGDGFTLLQSILNRMELQFDYTTGFDDRQSLAGVVETLLRSIPLTGACAMELVLDKQRLPYALKPVPVDKITWVVSSKAEGVNSQLIPRMKGTDGDIDLDYPTFLYAALDYDPKSAYTFSPLEPAINTSIFYSEVVEDIRRVATVSGHSRLLVQLNYEELIKGSPLDVRADAQKLADWVEGIRATIQKEIENLKPESAIVTFDSVQASYLNSEIGGSAAYGDLIQTIDAILATSMKCPASILGKVSAGSQNTASVESLLFLKNAASLQKPVATVLERAFTLACRMLGFAGYVRVSFDEISLRPDIENASFKAMRQASTLELLSLGFLGDEEAAQILDTGPLPAGFTPLSGTGFFGQKSMADAPNANDNAGTRAPSPTKGDKAPKSAGGKDNQTRK